MTLILSFKIIAIIFLLICSAISSGSETSLTAISKLRAIKYKDQGNTDAIYILKIKEIKDQFIIGVLLANNLFNILATVLFYRNINFLFWWSRNDNSNNCYDTYDCHIFRSDAKNICNK